MGISIIVVALLLWIAVKTYKDSVLTFEKGLFKSIQRLVKKLIKLSQAVLFLCSKPMEY